MSGKYLRTLVVMHVSNALLAWMLVFGKLGAPEWGVLGAGVATTIATFIGTGYYVALAWRHAREGGFLRAFPDRETIRSMLRVSLPSGLQQFLFAAGMTALYWVVGKVGTAELAAANVLTTLTLVALLPGIGFGLAASTLVAQALGRRDPDDARAWGWDVSRFAAVAIAAVCLVAIVAPDLLLRGFLHDADTREIARLPLRLVALLAPLDAIGVVLMNAIVGAGDARRVMVVSVGLQWLLFLPGAYLVGPVLGHGLLGIWILQAAYRLLQAALIARMWARGQWATVKL
jgi:putative MATE family efflux protein